MFEIRPASTEDKESIRQIYISSVGPEASVDETHWDRLIRAGAMLVAQFEQQVVGFGGIDVDATVQIKWLYLRPQHQRAGVGSEILQRLELLGWEAGLKALRLHSAPGTVNFYLRHGYREVGRAQEIRHDHDGVEMVKKR